MNLLKCLLLLSFVIYPRVLVTHDAEEILFSVHENSPYLINIEHVRLTNTPFQIEIAALEIIKPPRANSTKHPLSNSKFNSSKTEAEVPSRHQRMLQHESLDALYAESELLDENAFGKKLHHLIETHYTGADLTARQYSHYLIDRLIIESNTRLSYAQKQEEIQYLINSIELSVTENQMQSEVDFLMQALATLPLGAKSPQWREGWYSRLQQWSETNFSTHAVTTNNSDADNIHDDWQARVSDYQQVRGQLRQQLGDEQSVFEVAQEDLRNSYFTDKEVTLITITDNTIDLLNNINQ